MRSSLALLMLLVLTCACAVGEENDESAKQNYIRPYIANAKQYPKADRTSSNPTSFQHRDRTDTSDVCYTMQSVLVQKQTGSDVTKTVGYRTCTPSSQFQMKNSVLDSK